MGAAVVAAGFWSSVEWSAVHVLALISPCDMTSPQHHQVNQPLRAAHPPRLRRQLALDVIAPCDVVCRPQSTCRPGSRTPGPVPCRRASGTARQRTFYGLRTSTRHLQPFCVTATQRNAPGDISPKIVKFSLVDAPSPSAPAPPATYGEFCVTPHPHLHYSVVSPSAPTPPATYGEFCVTPRPRLP